MAASDHFGPQLQMFIPAGAFEAARDEGALSFSEGGGNVEALKAKKIEESKTAYVGQASRVMEPEDAHQEPFYANVEREGVKTPVWVRWDPDMKPRLQEGHHRVFVQADIDPTAEVPVVHGGKAMNAQGEYQHYNHFSPADARRWTRKR